VGTTQPPLFSSDSEVVEQICEVLQSVKGYPFDPAKDLPFVRDLVEQYPMLDVLGEIRQWRAWMLDYQTTKKVRHRARIEAWLRRAEQWRRDGGGGQRRGTAPAPGLRGRPEGATAFGDTSTGLERW